MPPLFPRPPTGSSETCASCAGLASRSPVIRTHSATRSARSIWLISRRCRCRSGFDCVSAAAAVTCPQVPSTIRPDRASPRRPSPWRRGLFYARPVQDRQRVSHSVALGEGTTEEGADAFDACAFTPAGRKCPFIAEPVQQIVPAKSQRRFLPPHCQHVVEVGLRLLDAEQRVQCPREIAKTALREIV